MNLDLIQFKWSYLRLFAGILLETSVLNLHMIKVKIGRLVGIIRLAEPGINLFLVVYPVEGEIQSSGVVRDNRNSMLRKKSRPVNVDVWLYSRGVNFVFDQIE